MPHVGEANNVSGLSHGVLSVTADPRATTERLYRAFSAGDGPALLELLHPEFVGQVTAGLPNDWGGVYRGPKQMLAECWGAVFSILATRPVPEEMVPTVDGRMVVLGHYRGQARASGRVHEAAFVHVLGFADDGRISRLTQVTDSARWHQALKT